MKYIGKYLSLALLLSGALQESSASTACQTSCASNVVTTWTPMTVGQNLWTQYHKLLFPDSDSDCCWVADLSLTYRYMQTRNACQMATALFGSNTLAFAGNDQNNGSQMVAEYFGMGSDTNTTTTLCPKIKNNVMDFQLAFSGEKAWMQINVPVVWTKYQVTPGCNAPVPSSPIGTNPLDGAQIVLTQTGIGNDPNPNIVYVNEKAVTFVAGGPAGTTQGLFYDTSGANQSTFGEECIQSGQNVNYDSVAALPGGAVGGATNAGYMALGVYGAVTAVDGNGAASAPFEPQLDLTVTSATVPSARNLGEALSGFEWANVTRQNNNFNFNPCGKWGIADIPIMLGYDFCKSDAQHLGAYLKLVIPTSTQVNPCFIQTVFNNYIGNGRHFEFGIGLSAHANFWVCDESSFGIYGDAYIDHAFGANQTRTFDLPNMPMSRYALLYQVNGSATAGYTVGNISALGDVNVWNGNVSFTRGEIVLDLIWACRNFEIGAGYSFVGQTSEKGNCTPCSSSVLAEATGNNYAYVGVAPQQYFGVGVNTADVSTANVLTGAGAPNAATTPAPFFLDTPTGFAAQVAEGTNPILSYGEFALVADSLVEIPQVEGNCSGFMGAQVLNKIFAHMDYVWRDCAWQPEFGILGSIGFSPVGKPTANYWDLGARLGFAF